MDNLGGDPAVAVRFGMHRVLTPVVVVVFHQASQVETADIQDVCVKAQILQSFLEGIKIR